MLKLIKSIAILSVAALLIFFGYKYWLHQQSFPSTDDAYVSAHVVNISTQINGKVIKTYVKNQQQIKAGDILFTLDSSSYKLKLAQAESDLKNTLEQISANKKAVQSAQSVITQRIAQLQAQQRSTKRYADLVQKNLISKEDMDGSNIKLKAAEAAVEQAKSGLANAQAALGDISSEIKIKLVAVAQAKLDVAHTIIISPAAGHIENFSLRVGDTVNAFQEVFAVVEDSDFWINANFKETDIAKIKVGQNTAIKVDMYPNTNFTGKVTSISTGSGTSFSLLPPENASGNWVKVTQRFPVKISISPSANQPLRLGASATVTIDASKNKE
jgi:membrane fusion protein, multidrug efflux system